MATHPGKSEATTTKEVAGAFGEGGPLGSEISEPKGEGDEPNKVQPNEAMEIIPAPDTNLEEPIPDNRNAQWTGTMQGTGNVRSGGDKH